MKAYILSPHVGHQPVSALVFPGRPRLRRTFKRYSPHWPQHTHAWSGRGPAVQLTYNPDVSGGWSPPFRTSLVLQFPHRAKEFTACLSKGKRNSTRSFCAEGFLTRLATCSTTVAYARHAGRNYWIFSGALPFNVRTALAQAVFAPGIEARAKAGSLRPS